MNRLVRIMAASILSRILFSVGISTIVAGLVLLMSGWVRVDPVYALAGSGIVLGAGCVSVAVAWSLHRLQSQRIGSSRAKAEAGLGSVRADYVRRAKELQDQLSTVEGSLRRAEQRLAKAEIRIRKTIESQGALSNRDDVRAKFDGVDKRFNQVDANLATVVSEAEKRSLIRAVKLAGKLEDGSGLFSQEEVAIVAGDLIRTDPFMAFCLLNEHNAFDLLPLTPRRKLASFLRDRGYWENSLSVLRAVAAQTKSQRDLSVVAQRESEIAVFKGEFEVSLQDKGGAYEAIPGHVLHVVGKALPKTQTGYTLRTHYTALAQRRAGLHVSIVSQVGENETPHEERVDFVNDIVYYSLAGDSKASRPLAAWLDDNIHRLSELVERVKPSLLHAHSDFLNAVSAHAVGRQFGIPVVYESRGFWEESWLSRTSAAYGIGDWEVLGKRWGLPDAYVLRKEREAESRKNADGVLTLARVMRDRIVSNEGDASHVGLVPNAVQADNFPVVDRDPDLAAELGIEKDVLVVGYISSIVEYEGIDVLLDAFHQLVINSTRRLCLLIVGDGAVLKDLKQQRDHLGTPNVIFTGRVPHDDVLKYYGMIDIFVVPRRPADVCHLVTPLKPFEAFSTGRAVVMSDVLALREIAEDSGAAELFEAGNPDSLVKVLEQLVADEPRRAALARTGSEWVRSERTWDRNAEVYVDLYESLGVRPFRSYGTSHGSGDKLDVDAMSKWINAQETGSYFKWFDTESDVTAEEVKRDGWVAKDFPAVPLDLPIAWDDVCASDRSWAFHLHTWEFMDPIVQAYAAVGNNADLDWCISRALDWLEYYDETDVTAEGSLAWYDMSLGLRSPRLMALIALAVKAGYPSDTIQRLMAGALRHQVEHALDRSFNPRTNHGYYAAVGQTVLGMGLRPLPGMVELERQGNERLAIMAATQFKDDGAHSEHSPGYHHMVLASFRLGIEQGLIEDEAVLGRISKAAHALGWMIKPDGMLVQFGDTSAQDMTSGRQSLTTDAKTNFLLSKGRQGSPNSETLATFEEAGYAFVRSPQPQSTNDHESASYLAFSASFHSRAHKHADDLNFVWSDRGDEILVDAGKFGYGELLPADSPMRRLGYYYDAQERQYVESTAAHNTVAIDGGNHERRIRKPYGSGLLQCAEIGGIYELAGKVEHETWIHGRRISFEPGKWLVVEDDLTSSDGALHDFRAWFNFAGHLEVAVLDEGIVRVRSEKWDEPLWMSQLSGSIFIEPARGELNPMRGWRSLTDRYLEPTWSLGFALHQETSGVITTVFNFGQSPLTVDPRVSG